MASRDELKALIDQVAEPDLETVRMMLEHHIHPSPPNPEIERMHQRSREYSSIVRRRFLETGKPGTIGTMGGTGHIGTHEGVPFGRQGFQYWDEKALVHQSLRSFDGQEIEVMERLSFSPDRTKLSCVLELSSGGRTVRFEEEFPVRKDRAQS
jgi:hypothetical protein